MRKIILILGGITLLALGLLVNLPRHAAPIIDLLDSHVESITPSTQPATASNPVQVTRVAAALRAPQSKAANHTTPPLLSIKKPSPRVYQGRPVADVIRNLDKAPNDWRDFNPETLTLRLYGETDVAFSRVSFSNNSKNTTWIGRNENTAGLIVAVSNQQTWNAEVNLPQGNSYRIISGQKAIVSEAASIALKCPVFPTTSRRSAAVELPPLRQAEHPQALTDTDLDNINISTVAVLYDEDTENDALRIIAEIEVDSTTEELIESNVLSSLDLANYYLLLSGIKNLEWELAGVAKIPAYTINDDLSMEPDLDAISLTNTSTGVFSRAYFTEKKADQGVLIVGGVRDYDGLSETPGNYSVVSWYHYEYLSALMAHELGHNFGCNHDRESDAVSDNNGKFAYGYTFTAAGDSLGTLMSYGGDYLLPYYSNPEVTYKGEPTGIPVDQAKAAYNARQIRENAAIIANFRRHDDDPRITQNPLGRNATPGQSFTLNVTATGPDLRYQWYKSATEPISGATTDTLALNAVTTGDSGGYFVAVTNTRTTVTSDIAYINIRAVTTFSVGGGGGGGGGGGAPSLWFVLSLTLLLIGRAIQRSVRS